MIELKSMDKKTFWRYRENVLKTAKMKPLEKKIDKFLSDNDIKYHFRYPISIGLHKHKTTGAVSFLLEGTMIALDVVSEDYDSKLYEMTRCKRTAFQANRPLSAVIPIKETLKWMDVKKQLKIFLGL